MLNREVLIQVNHWWSRGSVRTELLEKVERKIFPSLLKALKERQAIIIEGPRRVGKSSLLFQLIHHLIKSGVDPKQIVYASMDDPLLNKETLFEDIIDLLEDLLLKRSILESRQRLYLLLDEVAHLERWEFIIKRFYDQKYPFKFILTSSSAAFLKRRA